MNETEVRLRFPVTDSPDDMLLFQSRMGLSGVRVRLPNTRMDYRLPELLPLEPSDEAPHEAVVRLRRGAR